MANLPAYTLAITVTLSGSAISNVRVIVRNERSGNTISSDTDANGQTIMDAASISGGVVTGDVLTVFTAYQNSEGSVSHTVTTGGSDITLTLSTVPASDTLRYFTVQEFYDEMGYTSTDSQLIKAVSVVSTGSSVEDEIDTLTSKRFDDANAITDEYHDMKNKYQQIIFLNKGPVQSVTGFFINDASEGNDYEWRNLAYTLLDDFTVATGWTGASGGSDTITLSDNFTGDNINHGTSCMNVAKSGTNNDSVTISKEVSLTDFNDKTLKIDIYTDDDADLTATDSVELRFGSDSSNYYYKKWDQSIFSDESWTTLTMHFQDSDCEVNGSPDITACDYVAVVFTLAAVTTELTAGDIRLDHLRIEDEFFIEFDTNTGRVRITDSKDYPEEGNGQIKVDYTYGYTSVPREIKRLAILMTARHFMLMGVGKSLTAGREFTPNLEVFDKEINRILSKYRAFNARLV